MPSILTNKFALPQTIVDACANDKHKVAGNLSCTQLIDAPQVRILKKLNTYEEDVTDRLWMLMGTALHGILEAANINDERKRAFILTAETLMRQGDKFSTSPSPEKGDQLKRAANYIFSLIPVFFPETESRYLYEKTMTLEFGEGEDIMQLYGTFDLYDKHTGILYDYKFCSVYSWLFPESRKKWKQQTNVYAYMLEQEGYKVNGIRIVAFFRDWNDSGMLRNKDYPKTQVMEIPIELRPLEEIGSYILKRVNLHREAEKGNIPECTGEDRWAKANQYAVLKPGYKKALRVFGSKEECDIYIEENQHQHIGKLSVQVRPGGSVRCEKFCPVNKVCAQYKRELEFKEIHKDEPKA